MVLPAVSSFVESAPAADASAIAELSLSACAAKLTLPDNAVISRAVVARALSFTKFTAIVAPTAAVVPDASLPAVVIVEP